MFVKNLIRVFVLSNRKSTAYGVLVLTLLAVGNEIAAYNVGLITGDYYKIMNDKDSSAFWHQTRTSLLLISLMVALKSVKEFVSSVLSVKWREYLTLSLHEKYFDNLAFYRLNVLRRNVTSTDNIDQRITQDVDKMSASLGVLIPELLVSPFIIVFYSLKCFHVTGILGPLTCLIFFILTSLLNRLLIRRVSDKVYEQERCEGNFRAQHFRVRNNAEAVGFIGGGGAELVLSNDNLSTLIRVQLSITFRNLFLKTAIYLTDYLGSIISFIALAVPLFSGVYNGLSPSDLSMLISQNAFFTMYLVNCFTRLIDLSSTLTTFFATMNRIVELESALSQNTTYGRSSNNTWIERKDSSEEPYLIVKNVTIETPAQDDCLQRTLVRGFNFELRPHENVVITGPSGAGKSAFLRVLKNLWRETRGDIHWHIPFEQPEQVLFIASNPVLTSGCLAAQIVYPRVFKRELFINNKKFTDEVRAIFELLELEHLSKADLFDEKPVSSWPDRLSYGETQRLNLARVFYYRPRIVFLDEATNGLPSDLENSILRAMNDRNITIVQCGHRLSSDLFSKKLSFSLNN